MQIVWETSVWESDCPGNVRYPFIRTDRTDQRESLSKKNTRSVRMSQFSSFFESYVH